MTKNKADFASPFFSEKIEIPEKVESMNTDQLVWLSGYLYALAQEKRQEVPISAAVELSPIHVLYGSQTGNSRSVAEEMLKDIEGRDLKAGLFNIADFPRQKLKKKQKLLIAISTHGNGEPPDEAKEFYDFLMEQCTWKLDHIEYAVLALGDSSYEHFCKTGKDIYDRLEKLGAKPLSPLIECDLEFKPEAKKWRESLLELLKKELTERDNAKSDDRFSFQSSAEKEYDREHPYTSEVNNHHPLTTDKAEKEVYHIELSLEDSNLEYQPGDSLGVYPENEPSLVERFIESIHASPNEHVKLDNEETTLADAAKSRWDIGRANHSFLKRYAELTENPSLTKLVEEFVGKNRATEKRELFTDLPDLFKQFPYQGNPQDLFEILPEITPRLYSISSSPNSHMDEVHITVKKNWLNLDGEKRAGLTSGFLSRLKIGDTTKIYIHENRLFRLPQDPFIPIIMIGAGTGIAPYRSFLFERETLEQCGPAWLIFGEQNFRESFLYQNEIRKFLISGNLSRFNGAFSRDGRDKVYVQNKIIEHGKDLFDWIEQGARVYLCGDAASMAPAVEEALKNVVMEYGVKSENQAFDYLKKMVNAGRFLKDVY